MIQGFEFEHDGRKFSCTTESPSAKHPDLWWWFRVSGDAQARYAPFKASSSDTRASVQKRIVKYHDELQERRNAPPTPHWRRGAPAKAGTAPAPNGTPAASSAAPAAK